jgi:hypothetical protein
MSNKKSISKKEMKLILLKIKEFYISRRFMDQINEIYSKNIYSIEIQNNAEKVI